MQRLDNIYWNACTSRDPWMYVIIDRCVKHELQLPITSADSYYSNNSSVRNVITLNRREIPTFPPKWRRKQTKTYTEHVACKFMNFISKPRLHSHSSPRDPDSIKFPKMRDTSPLISNSTKQLATRLTNFWQHVRARPKKMTNEHPQETPCKIQRAS